MGHLEYFSCSWSHEPRKSPKVSYPPWHSEVGGSKQWRNMAPDSVTNKSSHSNARVIVNEEQGHFLSQSAEHKETEQEIYILCIGRLH